MSGAEHSRRLLRRDTAGAEPRPLLYSEIVIEKGVRLTQTHSLPSCSYSRHDGDDGMIIFKKLNSLLSNLPGGRRPGREDFVKILISKESLPNNLAKRCLRGDVLAGGFLGH